MRVSVLAVLLMFLPGCVPETDGEPLSGGHAARRQTPSTDGQTETPDLVEATGRMSAEQLAVGLPVVNTVGMLLMPIPAGEFMMGSQNPGHGLCRPVHRVTLSEPFYLSAHEVTQQQYRQVMDQELDSDDSRTKGPQNPVENISWEAATEFCRRLSELKEEQASGHVYRLPTEAEWEYACRAGTVTRFSFGDDSSQLSEYGWFAENADSMTHPVGQKKPNAWGLYDMHGNVWEWCSDWYGPYQSEGVVDPTGPELGILRVDRGGGWTYDDWYCESAIRGWLAPTLKSNLVGFRVVRNVAMEDDR